jgi:hypothetical protein
MGLNFMPVCGIASQGRVRMDAAEKFKIILGLGKI